MSDDVDLKRTRRTRQSTQDLSGIDRLPPHSTEAEQALLGCLLASPNECIPEAVTILKSSGPEAFYDLRHQEIYKVLVDMREQLAGIDVITVMQKLKDKQLLEKIGGHAYLSSLLDSVASAVMVGYYAEIVWEKYNLRKMIHVCTDAVGRVYDHQGDIDELFDEVERDILSVAESRVTSSDVTIQDLVQRSMSSIEAMHDRKGMLTGLSTGFADFDKMTNGLHPGEMIVIAARPSLGKTSIAINIAESVAIDQQKPVGIFSLEMTGESLVTRMICSRARVNLRNIREGFLAERDFPKLTSAAGRINKAPLIIDDSSALSILELRAKARRMQQQHDIKLLVIDYLQLLHSTSRKADNRQQEIADISSGVKALSKELNIPVIVLSQLNRDMEREKGRRPRLSDLRESGAIEQDADVVGLLYKPKEKEADNEDESDCFPVNLLIAKQRNGPTGDIYLTFLRSFTRFEIAAKVSDEDVPGETMI